MKLLIVDDHAVVRQGVRQVLSDAAGREFRFTEARSGAEALDAIRSEPFDLVILDISLPDRGGLEVLKQIKAQRPELPVLILSMHGEEQYAVRALKAGAAGYLTKESALEQLLHAVDRIMGGARYITPSLAEALAVEAVSGHADAPHERLSDRELEILRLIASGLTVSGIAEKLFLSVKTVSTYRSRILQKMQMKNNAELIQYAIRRGLVE